MGKRLLFILSLWGVQITGICQDTIYVERLLELSNYYFVNSHNEKIRLDSSLLFARKAETTSLQLKYPKGLGNSYISLSHIFRDAKIGEIEKGKEYLNKAIAIFSREKYFASLGDAYHELATYYSIDIGAEIKERFRLEELALSAYMQSKDTLRLANINKELGDLYNVTGDFPKSLVYLKTSANLYQSINYPRIQGVYDLLGIVSGSLGDYKEAIRYGLLAVEMAETAGDTTSQMATFYNRIGMTYNKMNDFEKGLLYFKQGLTFAERNNDQNAVFILTLNVTRTLIKLNKPEEALALLQKFISINPAAAATQEITVNDCFLKIYSALKKYPLAVKYYDRSVWIFKNDTTQSEYTRGFICRSLIQYLFVTKQYSQLPYYLKTNESIASKLGSLRDISDNHLWWFRVDSAEGRYVSAINHFQKYKSLNDSLFNETKSKQIAQLQIQYETDKKDQDIRIKDQSIELLTKKSQLQQATLHQARTSRNMVLGGAILLILLLALVYNRYRLKQKTNRKLTAQQEEIEKKNETLQHLADEREWLVKEIHHRVKNNFHIVQGLLGTQSGYLKNEEAINALADSKHRVQAMSLIHQKLYQSDNLSAINMADYIHELTRYLRDSFRSSPSIQFNLQVEPIELDLSHCIPLGLILNEAITNAIKYAFPNNQGGLISILFKRKMLNHLILVVSDNGIGLPASFNIASPASMGMRLMKGLSEDIDATFLVDGHAGTGTEIKLEFVFDPEVANSHYLNKTELTATL